MNIIWTYISKFARFVQREKAIYKIKKLTPTKEDIIVIEIKDYDEFRRIYNRLEKLFSDTTFLVHSADHKIYLKNDI